MTNFARDLFADLKESRLWPLALALVVALVAVPALLTKPAMDGEQAAAPTVAAGRETLPELQPVVNITTADDRKQRKSVTRLSRKNPFEPLVKPRKNASSAASGDAGAGAAAGGGAGEAASGGAISTGTPSTGAPSTGTGGGSDTTSGEQKFYTYVASVRFGEIGQTEAKKLKRMRALPSTDNPIVVFLGATTDAESAVFLVSSGVETSGEGTCKPSPDECTFLYMKAGETQTFDTADDTGAPKTYELTLRSIDAEEVDQPNAGSSSRRRDHARAGVNDDRNEDRRKARRVVNAFERIGF